MKKTSRFFLFVFILLVALGTAFYFGYTPLRIPQGHYGVIVSKTSGVSEKPIEPGVFSWNWELLIPTNATVRTFSAEPYKVKKTKSGILPSGEVYSKMLKETPDFSYSFTCDLELKFDGRQCVQLVKDSNIATDSDLQKKLSEIADQIIASAEQSFISQIQNSKAVDFDLIQKQIQDEYSKKLVSVSSIEFSGIKTPDAELYNSVKKMYMDYVSLINSELQDMAEAQAKDISEYAKNLSKLERFGKVLKDNPELSDFLKTSKDLNETLKTIFSF